MTQMNHSLWQTLKLRRNVVGLLAFLGFVNLYTLRANLSVAIVEMTRSHPVMTHGNRTIYQRDFDWDTRKEEDILGAFFFGYVATPVIGGWLAIKIGGATVFGLGILMAAILTMLMPAAANIGAPMLIAARLVEGLFEGVAYSSIHAVWAHWAPPQERTRLASFGFSGSFFGIVITFPACAFLANQFGWPSAFYVPGVIAAVWWLTWFIYVKNDPKDDPHITQQELKFLQETLGNVNHGAKVHYPWKKFLTSMPVWAIICAHFCENWGYITMLCQLPMFLNDAFKFDIRAAGFLSALPYLLMTITLQIAGVLVDLIRSRNIFTNTQVRKIFNCGAFISQMIFMTAAAFSESAILSVLFITLAIGLGAFAWAAFGVNHLDVAPQYASVLMGLSNSIGSTPGVMSPFITGQVVKHKNREEWKIVFFISSAMYLFGAIFYAIFGSGERQAWSFDNKGETEADRKPTYDRNKVVYYPGRANNIDISTKR